MKYESLGKKLSGPVALSVIGLSAVVGAGVVFDHAQEQFIQGFEQATVYRYHPSFIDQTRPTVSEVQPLQPTDTGANTSDYARALGFLGAGLVTVVVAGGFARKRLLPPSPKLAASSAMAERYDSCELSLDEVQTFDLIVAKEFNE